jgi:formylmethanofuran dehydrogenase subunit E
MTLQEEERLRALGYLGGEFSGDVGSELQSLMKKAEAGTLAQEERLRIQKLRNTLQDRYLKADLAEMFIVMDPGLPAPRPARILASLECESCGERAMESRTRRFDGKTLCVTCFERCNKKGKSLGSCSGDIIKVGQSNCGLQA